MGKGEPSKKSLETGGGPPRTPARELVSDSASQDNGGSYKPTPRDLPADAGDEKQTKLRDHIGKCMIYEIVTCPTKSFFDDYLPPLPTKGPVPKEKIVDLVKKDLVAAKLLSVSGGTVQFTAYQLPPSGLKHLSKLKAEKKKGKAPSKTRAGEEKDKVVDEKTVFAAFATIGNAIRSSLKKHGFEINPYPIAMCPDTWLDSDIHGSNFRIDACTTSQLKEGEVPDIVGKKLHVTNIIVPMEFKLHDKDHQENRLQITAAANHIMNDDVRRMFIYAISVENDKLTVWYYSRSHSVLSRSFSFCLEPLLLVELFIRLFCASKDQLGIDKYVSLLDGHDSKTYLYELPADGVTRLASQFFKTTEIVDELRSNRIAGRNTRVWKVVQVKSKDNPDPIDPQASPLILKDAWINASADDEHQIQQKVFCDIDKFYADHGWRSHPLLSDIEGDDVEDIEDVLKNYKNFFSLIRLHYSGEPNKPISQEAHWTDGSLFFDPPKEEMGVSSGSQRTGSLNPSGKRSNPSQSRNTSKLEREFRAFESKRRCFFVYEHVCRRISDLPTLGDAMDVLFQAYAVLMVMFCAGWIHRDISHGNILAFKEEGGWQVKLSDLEYAKRFPPDSAQTSSDPKTGTPFFMAHEILTSSSLSGFYHQNLAVPKRTSRRAARNTARRGGAVESRPVVIIIHNYQHDLESLWWMVLWLVTMRTNYQKSFDAVRPIFSGSNPASEERKDCFTQGIAKEISDKFHPSTENFVSSLETLRRVLLNGYKSRHPEDLCNPEQYSDVCSWFPFFFGEMEKDRDVWGPLPLSNPTWLVDVKEEQVKPSRVQPEPGSVSSRRSARIAERSLRQGAKSQSIAEVEGA
ncbi:other/FunK1 protein kinase [Coprinopsis cinerea AmutBmut pab1-1]|nr:other/FunK1 protein kinase [Coprinopsis cinerea AmutBmut pab1-1]